MKTTVAILLLLLLLSPAVEGTTKKRVPRKWKAAVYHGLIMGKSTRKDAFRALGKPIWVGNEADTGIPMMDFTVRDPVLGKLSVYFGKGEIISSMALYPDRRMTEAEAIKLLGTNFTIGRYSVDDCLNEGGVAPRYETADGFIRDLEYRNRGLSVSFHKDFVEAIGYNGVGSVPTESRCKKNVPKKSATP